MAVGLLSGAHGRLGVSGLCVEGVAALWGGGGGAWSEAGTANGGSGAVPPSLQVAHTRVA